MSTSTDRPVDLGMMAQLRLGMDLTKVTLPTALLEPRSLLEMLADFIGFPHLFLEYGQRKMIVFLYLLIVFVLQNLTMH